MSLTPATIFEEKISARLKAQPMKDVNATYQFDISGNEGGQWYIKLNDQENIVARGTSDDPTCTISMADTDLVNLVQGTLKPQMAFMMGKLKVKGDLGLALKLGSILKT